VITILQNNQRTHWAGQNRKARVVRVRNGKIVSSSATAGFQPPRILDPSVRSS
jgi:hypothetical protein